MFLQPFLLATLAAAWFRLAAGPRGRMAPLVVLAVFWLITQSGEVDSSRGRDAGGMPEIPEVSSARVVSQFQEAVRSLPGGHLVLTTHNLALAKIQALYTRGLPTHFLSRIYFDVRGSGYAQTYRSGTRTLDVEDLRRRLTEKCTSRQFCLHDEDKPEAANTFETNEVGIAEGDTRSYLVAEGPRLTVLNRWHGAPSDREAFVVKPLGEVRNHLCFIDSELGKYYYSIDRPGDIGMYRLEKDILVPGQTMAAFGRHQLYQVINPSPTVRLVLSVSATLQANGENRLLPAAVIGATRDHFDFVGRGSGRVISPPLKPQVIGGRSYVAVDFGRAGRGFSADQSGLLGAVVARDTRALVGFVRDVSALSEEDYARLAPPSRIEAFPQGLLDPHLEYSGVCEDGWVSAAAYFHLAQKPAHRRVVVRGTVPALPANPHFATELRVLVDRQEVARQRLTSGEFHLEAPLPAGVGRRRLELRFSDAQRLPNPDNRPMAALLAKVGFAEETEDDEGDDGDVPATGVGGSTSPAGQ
jgi:hypothetical protein